MIWRCRGVSLAMRSAAVSRHADSLLESRDSVESAFDRGEQFIAADRLLDEVRSACLHGLNRDRHVAVAGDHDGRQSMARIPQPPQQLETIHSRQIGIDHQACFLAGTIGFEECLAGRIVLDVPAVVLQHGADHLAQVAVVIHHEDDRRPCTAGRFGTDAERARAQRIVIFAGEPGSSATAPAA